jgi:hypothetical protein
MLGMTIMTNSDNYHSSFSAVPYMQLGGVVFPLWMFFCCSSTVQF